MSMFENKTKPELERGNFIAYADEPNTIVDNAGGGGGGDVQTLHTHYDSVSDIYVLDTEITFNEIKSAFDASSIIRLELANESDQYLAVCQMIGYESYYGEADPLYNASFIWQGSTLNLQAESPDSPLAIP